MASGMNKLYKAIGTVVKIAASYLKVNDIRTNEVMEELELMTAGVGLGDEEVQFPIDAVRLTDLEERLPGMEDRGGLKEVLRFVVETPDEQGNTEVALEVWKKTRKMHVMVREIGQLHAITIQWGLFNISLNVIAIKTGECEEEGSVMAVDSGDGPAFFVRQFDFAVFRVFVYEEEEISAGKRLLFMTIIDAERHPHISVEQFAQWEAGMVLDELELRKPGDRIKRYSAEEAGLVPVERSGDDENLLTEDDRSSTLTETIRDVLEEEDEENPEDDLGQSPDLINKGEKTKAEGRAMSVATGGEQSRVERDVSPGNGEILRNVGEDEDEADFIDAIEFSGLNKGGEKVVLTTDQLRGIKSLFEREETDWSEEAMKKEAEGYDPISFLRSFQETDPEAKLVRVRKSVHQPWIEEDKKKARELAAAECIESESEAPMSGKEMWSEEDEDSEKDDEEEELETEVMPDVTGSTEASIDSPRGELSMNSNEGNDPMDADDEHDQEDAIDGDVDGNEDEGENEDDDDESMMSPPTKKIVVQWTEAEERMAIPAASRSADWSPVLVKVNDGRPIENVDTTTSSDDERFMEEAAKRYEERSERRSQMDRELERELEDGMRHVTASSGESAMIPNVDVYEQVFHEIYNQDDEAGGAQVEEDVSEDEGVCED